MLRIEKYTYEQINDRYPMIHNQVFGTMPPGHFPGMVYLVFEGEKYIGFMSVYYHNFFTLYIQRAGMPPDLREQRRFSRGHARAFFSEVMEYLKKEGHKLLIAHVENTNIPALLLALHTGWIISGVHTDTAGKTYVRILKDLR